MTNEKEPIKWHDKVLLDRLKELEISTYELAKKYLEGKYNAEVLVERSSSYTGNLNKALNNPNNSRLFTSLYY